MSVPYSQENEDALLGAAMISESALDILARDVEPGDFYLPRNQIIADHMIRMQQARTRVDPVTVADEIKRSEMIDAIGGPSILTTLQANVPSSNNAESYARVVLDYAVRRRLLFASQDVMKQCHDGNVGIEALFDHARRSFGSVDMTIMAGQPDPDIETFLKGNTKYDWLLEDLLERRDRMIITGAEGKGKALALDVPIATIEGWKTIGTLEPTDYVFSPQGRPVKILGLTEVMFGHSCYQVVFSDGTRIVADADHEWLTETLRAREAEAQVRRRSEITKPRGTDQRWKRTAFPQIVTTQNIASSLRARNGHCLNHAIPCSESLRFPSQPLPIDPYVFGVWLGDGHTDAARVTIADEDVFVINEIAKTGESIHRVPGTITWALTDGAHRGKGDTSATFVGRLRSIGVMGFKHIPELYATAGVEQRRALLQGLMDTDGTIDKKGLVGGRGHGMSKVEFSVCNKQLAEDVIRLVWSLGIKASMHSGPSKLNGRIVGTRYRIGFQTKFNPFRLPRKADRWVAPRTHRSELRYITSVEPTASVPVRCIQVEGGMYVAGQECIPTHNSTFLRQIAVCAAAGIHPFHHSALPAIRVLVVDAENSEIQMRRRFNELISVARKRCRELNQEFDPTNLRINVKTDGLDLMQRADVRWLTERCEANQPQLLVIGPLYKLHAGDPNDESPARHVSRALDIIRNKYGCALMMEAHSPYSESGGKRIGRPYGASLWSRWPEFGFCIAVDPTSDDEATFDAWRGPRDERIWPRELRRGGSWPWSVPSVPSRTDGIDNPPRTLATSSVRSVDAAFPVPPSIPDLRVVRNEDPF